MFRQGIMAGLAVAALAGAAQAGVYTLVDGNSVATFNTNALSSGSRVGMDGWVVDGVNHMYSQWFWYRTSAMASEARINSLPLIVGGTTDSNFDNNDDTLFLSYGTLNTFTIDVRFVLDGGSAGSNLSDVAEQVTITNHSSAPITFSFFQYSDFDLNSDILDDFVGQVNANTIQQSDFGGNFTVSETVVTPAPNGVEVNTYPVTLLSLDDGAVTNLNGNAGPLAGPADYTWAFQWDVTIQPGGSFQISKDKQITPTPGALALLGLGGLALTRRRR